MQYKHSGHNLTSRSLDRPSVCSGVSFRLTLQDILISFRFPDEPTSHLVSRNGVSAACQICSHFHYDIHMSIFCPAVSILGTKRWNAKRFPTVSSYMRHVVYSGHIDRAVLRNEYLNDIFVIRSHGWFGMKIFRVKLYALKPDHRWRRNNSLSSRDALVDRRNKVSTKYRKVRFHTGLQNT